MRKKQPSRSFFSQAKARGIGWKANVHSDPHGTPGLNPRTALLPPRRKIFTFDPDQHL
jgi:hypothetical protein